MEMAWRWAQGLPMYNAPSINHVAAPYFPLYFILLGFIYKFTGPVYWAGRLFSTLCAVATGIVVYRIVKREAKNHLLGLLCSGIWFAGFSQTGFFYDLIRVDSLAIVLLIAGYAVGFSKDGWVTGVLAGLFLAMSVIAKQNHLAFIAPVLFAMIIRKNYQGAIACAGIFAAVVPTFIYFYDQANDGWFIRFTMKYIRFRVMEEHITEYPMWFYSRYMIPTAIAFVFAFRKIRERKWADFFGNPWLGYLAASFALSYVFRLPGGGYVNAKIPVALAAALVTGTLLPEAIGPAWIGNEKFANSFRSWVLVVMAWVTILALYRPLNNQIPDKRQWIAAQNLHSFVQSQKGLVVVPYHLMPEPNVLKFHEMSYRDLSNGIWSDQYLGQIRKDLNDLKPEAVLADKDFSTEKPAYMGMIKGMVKQHLDRSMRVKMTTGTRCEIKYLFYRSSHMPDMQEVAAPSHETEEEP